MIRPGLLHLGHMVAQNLLVLPQDQDRDRTAVQVEYLLEAEAEVEVDHQAPDSSLQHLVGVIVMLVRKNLKVPAALQRHHLIQVKESAN